MKSSKLKLNSDKTEIIIIGTKQQRHKLYNHFPVKLLDNNICPSGSVRNLGVVFDSDFSVHKHVSNIYMPCFYPIRDLRRIRRHIPLSTAKTIFNYLISSRLDYCNEGPCSRCPLGAATTAPALLHLNHCTLDLL